MTPEDIKVIDQRIDARMEAIADLAVQKAIAQIYVQVGKGVLQKAAWVLGIAVFALFMWLAGAGHIK